MATREIAWARLGLGKVYYGLKEYEAARSTFEDLINTNNQLTQAYDWLTRCLKALGDTKSSQEVLSTALEISPKAEKSSWLENSGTIINGGPFLRRP